MQSRSRRNAITEAVALTLVTGATRGTGRAIAGRRSTLRNVGSLVRRAHSGRGAIEATTYDVVPGQIYDTNDILAEPHFPARHNIVEIADEDGGVIRMPRITPRIEGIETAVRHLGPARP